MEQFREFMHKCNITSEIMIQAIYSIIEENNRLKAYNKELEDKIKILIKEKLEVYYGINKKS